MKRPLSILIAGSTLVILAGALAQSNKVHTTNQSKEWPTYGHDSGGMRFSPLTEITPANVDRLKVAWVYHMRPAGVERRRRQAAAAGGRCGRHAGRASVRARPGARRLGLQPSENTPLVINGVMYMSTPYSRVVAVDPTTGKEIWAFHLPASSPSTRGMEYWAGDAQTPAQIVFGSSDGKLYSWMPKPGSPTMHLATTASST